MMSADGDELHRPQSAPPWAPLTTPSPRAVTLTVVAYASRYQSVVRVPAEVPTGTLFGQLGGPVGVTQVSSLLLLDGTPLPPESSLQENGVGDGASVLVLSVYDTPPGETEEAAPEGWAPFRPPADDSVWGMAPSGVAEHRTVADMTVSDTPVDWAPRAERGEPAASGAPAPAPSSMLPPWPPEPTGQTGPGDLPRIASPFALGVAAPPLEPDVLGYAGATGTTGTRGRRPTYERHRLLAAGAAAVVVALAAGVLIGRVSAPWTPGPTAADFSDATQAATTWLAAGTYRPAMIASGASPSAGRAGTVTGTVRRVGWARSGDETDVWFIIRRAGRAPLGLTVQLHGSELSEAPTVTPLSFGGGEVPPKAPPASSTTSTAPSVITGWAARTFGRNGPLITTFDVGLIGHAAVLGLTSIGSGAVVYRVSVDLSSAAPGTPARRDAAVLARDQARADSLQGTVTTDQSRLTTAKAAVTNDAAKVATITTTVTADTNAFNAANAAEAAANKALAQAQAAKPGAPPPSAASVQAAQQAATKARQTKDAEQAQLAAAQDQLNAAQTQEKGDQTTLADAQSELSAGESSLAAAQAARTEAQGRIPPALSAVGTYDVWVVGGRVRGWVPAGFAGV
jgi:hypothetical protein